MPRDHGGDRGAVLPVLAITLVLVVLGASFAVDVGRVAVRGREARNVADLAALDAARVVDPEAPTLDQEIPVTAEAVASAARNGFVDGADGELVVTLGTWSRADGFVVTAPDEAPDAVRVRTETGERAVFVPAEFPVDRTAVAIARSGAAGLVVGSTTASVSTARSELLDVLLGELLGASVSLDAVAYGTLADAEVDLGVLAVALGLDADDLDGLLGATWSATDLVAGLTTALAGTPAGTVVGQLVVGTSPAQVRLGDVLAVDVPSATSEAISIGALDLLEAVAWASTEGGTFTVPLDLDVAGLAQVDTTVAVLQAPQHAFGPEGTTVRTAQLRIDSDADVGELTVGAATSGVHLPLVVEVGRGQATSTAIDCGAAADPTSVSVDATTGTVVVTLGDLDGATATSASVAELAGLLRLDVLAQATVDAGSGSLLFTPPYSSAAAQSVGAGAPDPLLAVDALDVTLTLLELLPVGITGDAVVDALLDLVNPVLDPLVGALLDAVGVEVGTADVAVPSGVCRPTSLVQ